MKVSAISSDYNVRLLSVLAFILCGAIALPMLPVWQGAVRLVAAIVLLSILPATPTRKYVCAVFVGLGVVSLAAWGGSLVQYPFAHMIHALTDVYGQPITLFGDSALLFFDLICVTWLCLMAISMNWRRDRLVGMYTCCALFFWIWTLFSLGSNLALGNNSSLFAQMITGASGWATWVYWAVVPIFLVRDDRDVYCLLTWAGSGGLIVGGVIAIQWLAGDYSYILDAPNLADYFYRVRGTSYYHAPATYTLVLMSGVVLALTQARSSKSKWLVGLVILFLIEVAFLNGTRALNLSLLMGALVVCFGAVRQKNYTLFFLTVLLMLYIASGIFYLKPVKPSVADVEVKTFVEANSDRALLAISGCKLLPSVLWSGSGIGTLELPLPGTVFNGAKSTYSTHVLYLDIILMAGLPALLSILVMFSIAAWRGASCSLITRNCDTNYRALSLLAVLVMFSVGCFFLPQERNELIGVMFLISTLALLNPKKETVHAQERVQFRWPLGMIVCAVVGWTFLTSPAYVFPAIEFSLRHGSSVIENDERVMVTEPLMKPLVQFFLTLCGGENSKVLLLQDSVEKLPQDKTWVLWSPARDFAYPELRHELGYQVYRQAGDAPSLQLPYNWWVLPSSQPIIDTLYIGTKSIISVPIQELGKVHVMVGAKPIGIYEEGTPLRYVVSDKKHAWKVQLDACMLYPSILRIEPEKETNKYAKSTSLDLSGSSSFSHNLSIGSEGFPSGTEVAITGLVKTWPNRAPSASVKGCSDDGFAVRLVDMDYGTGIVWEPKNNFSVLFDFTSKDAPCVAVYRMVAMNRKGVALGSRYSWLLDGSIDGKIWINIDKRANVSVSHNPLKPSAFVMKNKKAFRYYRITFSSSKDSINGISEIELYPIS